MAVAGNARPISLTAEDTKARSPWADTWQQFSANRLAVLGLGVVILIIVVGVTADFWRRLGLIEDPTQQHQQTSMAQPMTCATDNAQGTPEFCYLFGSDDLGRDMFSRTVYGTQVSLAVAVVGATVTITIGTLYGMVAGFYGGGVAIIIIRIVYFLFALP